MPAAVEWFDDLDAVAADADGALDRARQPVLYDRLDWFRLTRRHILPDARLAVARARDGADALWLFLVEPAPRQAAPLASWYTLRFAPVLSGAGGRLLPVMAQALRRRFDRMALHPLDHPLTLPSWRCFARRCSTNWTIDLPADGDFAAYWSARPARLRNTVARRRRSHPVAITIARTFDPALWTDYEEVYAHSWKPREGSPAFLRALAEQEAAAGALRLGIARDAAGRAVAAQFWLVEHGVATIHKLAHREDAKAGSPGSLLSEAMFRDAIERDRIRRIDFGLGDEPYKADWMDVSAPVWRAEACRLDSLAGLRSALREWVADGLGRR